MQWELPAQKAVLLTGESLQGWNQMVMQIGRKWYSIIEKCPRYRGTNFYHTIPYHFLPVHNMYVTLNFHLPRFRVHQLVWRSIQVADGIQVVVAYIRSSASICHDTCTVLGTTNSRSFAIWPAQSDGIYSHIVSTCTRKCIYLNTDWPLKFEVGHPPAAVYTLYRTT